MARKVILNLENVNLSEEARLKLGDDVPDKLELRKITKEELEKECHPAYEYLI